MPAQVALPANAIESTHGTSQSIHRRAVIPEQSSQGMFVVSVALTRYQM